LPDAPDDLINKGVVVHRSSAEKGRTFIVTGLYRSGTSLVASILQEAGIFMGSEINDIVFEDEAIAAILTAGDTAALQRLIDERDAGHTRWGFKYPMLCDVLAPGQLSLFRRPRLIVTFRDHLAIAARMSLSEYKEEPIQVLRDLSAGQTAMTNFISELGCPSLLLSYDKALAFPQDFIDSIMRFCDTPPSAELRERLLALVEPNRQRYIAGARQRYEGVIEGVRNGQLYGWCRLTHSTDPLTLDVSVDERVVLRLVADTFRQDLLDASIGQGRHGFFIGLESLRARPDSVIRVAVVPHGIELDKSGTRLCDFAASA
jgi:hypothetical protein